jgi:hypothetical protein
MGYLTLLKSLGLKVREEYPSVIISGKESLKQFQKKIGFVEGCRVSVGGWKTLTKNEVLNMAIESFEKPKIIWGKQLI